MQDVTIFDKILALPELVKINRLLVLEEKNDQSNPLRKQKIALLKNFLLTLPHPGTISTKELIISLQIQSEEMFKASTTYNTLIKAYDGLEDMKSYIRKKNAVEVYTPVLTEIHVLQNILVGEGIHEKPSTRLEKVKSESSSNTCCNAMREGADYTFMGMLKAFWSLLTGQSSRYEQKFLLFKNIIQDIPPASQEMDVQKKIN